MSLLTGENQAFFEEHGYVKLPNVVPEECCEAVVDVIGDCLGHDPPIRQHPSVYQAFAEVLDEERLWVSLDKCNMTPPRHPEHPELSTSFIHVDADLSEIPSPRPRPYGVQGVLYLSDVGENGGGFQYVPEAYRTIDEIIAS